jgi:hypothetical protein
MNNWWQFTGHIIALMCCGYAFWRGGIVEKYGAAIIAIGWTLSPIAQTKFGSNTALIIIDICGLTALFVLSLWSRKVWTIFASAFQLNAVVSHIAVILVPNIAYPTYITGIGLWGGYGLIFAFAGGLLAHEKSLKDNPNPN